MDVEEEEDADVEEEDRSQDREADFVRACEIEMHMGSAQELICIEIHRKSTGRQSRDTRFVRACAVDMLTDISQEPFCMEIYRKMAADTSGDIVLCEPAQSKCTWTCHKRHFVWKIAGKMPDASDTTSIEKPGLNTYRKNPSMWPHCLGKNK